MGLCLRQIYLIGFFLPALVPSPVGENSLYDDSDSITILTSSNFNSTVFGTRNGWIIEFYNTWCGHCIAFAPIYKAHAKDVHAWRSVVAVGAIDCADEANVPICREYDVRAYPTIKFFKPYSKPGDLGIVKRHLRDEVTLRQSLIDFVESEALETYPPDWPNFFPSVKGSPQTLWQGVPATVRMMVVIVEKNESYTGKEVMLDMIERRDVKVVRVLPDNRVLLTKLGISTDPAMVLLFRNLRLDHYTISEHNRESYLEFIQQHLLHNVSNIKPEELGGADEGLGAGVEPNGEKDDSQNADQTDLIKDQVYMVDLDNAVRYSLTHEVVLNKVLDGQKLQALRAYLEVLTKYYPGRTPVKTFLNNLHRWLVRKSSIAVSTTDYLAYINRIQSPQSFLPTKQEWMGCRGSKPNFRGYPCSLWTLFHTLTVEAYNRRNKTSTYNPLEVLTAMEGYIKYYFGCEQCSKHFQEMASTLAQDVKEAANGVLWLWQAHNRVNTRLHGESSEDPQHPKVQFPPGELCFSCQLATDEGGQWDLAEVLTYLVARYSASAISMMNTAPFSNNRSVEHTSLGSRTFRRRESLKPLDPVMKRQVAVNAVSEPPVYVGGFRKRPMNSTWGFSAIDVSLCVMLYVSSAIILLTVYFIVIVKRRMRKKTYQKLSLSFI